MVYELIYCFVSQVDKTKDEEMRLENQHPGLQDMVELVAVETEPP